MDNEQKLPIDHPLTLAAKIYAKRLGVFLLVACANAALLGLMLTLHLAFKSVTLPAVLLLTGVLGVVGSVIFILRIVVHRIGEELPQTQFNIKRHAKKRKKKRKKKR